MEELQKIVEGLDRINSKLEEILEIWKSEDWYAPPWKTHKKLTEDEKIDIHETNFPHSGSVI